MGAAGGHDARVTAQVGARAHLSLSSCAGGVVPWVLPVTQAAGPARDSPLRPVNYPRHVMAATWPFPPGACGTMPKALCGSTTF